MKDFQEQWTSTDYDLKMKFRSTFSHLCWGYLVSCLRMWAALHFRISSAFRKCLVMPVVVDIACLSTCSSNFYYFYLNSSCSQWQLQWLLFHSEKMPCRSWPWHRKWLTLNECLETLVSSTAQDFILSGKMKLLRKKWWLLWQFVCEKRCNWKRSTWKWNGFSSRVVITRFTLELEMKCSWFIAKSS